MSPTSTRKRPTGTCASRSEIKRSNPTWVAEMLNKPLTILLVELVFPEKFRAAALLVNFIKTLAQHQNGQVIGTKGEKIVCHFADCQAALDAAQATLQQSFDPQESVPLIRAAIIHLPNVENEKDVAVATDLAAKAIGVAAAGEVVVPKQTVAFLPRGIESCRLARLPPSAAEEIYLISNLDAAHSDVDKTRLPGELKLPSSAEKKVMLWMGHANKQLTLGQGKRIATFGRDEANDLVVQQESASRHHGYFEYKAGSIFVVDKSTNGTFVCSGSGKEKILNSSLPLPAEGYISLGGEAPGEHPYSIHFSTVIAA